MRSERREGSADDPASPAEQTTLAKSPPRHSPRRPSVELSEKTFELDLLHDTTDAPPPTVVTDGAAELVAADALVTAGAGSACGSAAGCCCRCRCAGTWRIARLSSTLVSRNVHTMATKSVSQRGPPEAAGAGRGAMTSQHTDSCWARRYAVQHTDACGFAA